MTARVWTEAELDRVHPLPKGTADGIRNRPPWFWRVDQTGPVAFTVAPDDGCEVWVDAGGRLCSSDGDPPADVALAVILASKGLDSMEAMAASLEDDADCEDDLRADRYLRKAAAMLRRGTVPK